MAAKKQNITSLTMIIACIGAISGLLFGYNTAVISGVLYVFSDLFHLSILEKANIVSFLIFGALIGAVMAGFLSDRIGRKKTVILTAFVYVVGGILLTFAHSLWLLFLGRFITGLGVGLGSLVVPLYLSEMAPVKFRGALVTVNQLMVTIGILLSYILNYCFDYSDVWRWLFVVSLVFSLIQGVSMFFLPESPTWLLLRGKLRRAKSIFKRVRPQDNIETVIKRIEKNKKLSGGKVKLRKTLVSAIIVGVSLSIIQQITGVNAVFYYAPDIFKAVGFADQGKALLATISIGAINVIATILSMWLLDIKGRRPLLIVGTAGMFIGLICLAIYFFIGSQDLAYLALLSIMFYVVFFAIGLGPIAWLIIAEIFPLAIRGKMMAICVFANWLFNYIVSLTFLPLVSGVGEGPTFLIFALITAVSFFFILKRVPETKGKTLEEIEGFWRS